MARTERQDAVLSLLKDLTGLEPLKQLFWHELNYERINQSLSRRGWTETAAKALADDPVLFAAGGEDEGFHVIYSRLSSDSLLIGHERPVVSKLLQDHPYSLFVFSNKNQTRWHFLNVKYDEQTTKRRLFRRITVGPEERLRTASERIGLLDLSTVSPDLFGLSPLTIQKAHDDAFDVEAVTDEFFKQYAEVFSRVESLIRGISNHQRRRLFTQRLFNRLMFIAFIQKKGWLKFNNGTDYLDLLWSDYRKHSKPNGNFYNNKLKLLFFHGLNNSTEVNLVKINRGGFLKTEIGDVPYLNGGLFEKDEDDEDSRITIPDEAVDLILNKLFNRFNFTVTESTPLDIEVAVDPEMLGKVFEELVTGRHESGSYYTPKPVVSFMCREALKGYLSTVSGEKQSALQQFVDDHNPQTLRNPERTLEALRSVKICDPACGSGAYLLGMLHELIDLRSCLFAARNLDPVSSYNRKLETIQNSLYGVDLDAFAVNIARLRLWLSLSVEFDGEEPPPLPNLDFKIETGDSLTSPDPSGGLQLDIFRQHQVENYFRLKADYLKSHGGKKLSLKKEIDGLRREITEWAHPGVTGSGFDWQVEFAEVFANNQSQPECGFDVVLANPPYVRADAQFKHLSEDEAARQKAIAEWKDYRAALLKSDIYKTIYEKWDLYIPFLERAHQLLRQDGEMVFIIPDAYNAAKYAKKSHEFFLISSRITRIDFCTELPLFNAGVYNTILHFTKTKPAASYIPIRVRRWGEKSDEFETNVEILPSVKQVGSDAAIFKVDGKAAHDISTTDCVTLDRICYISYGLRANSDDRDYQGEFTTDDCLSDFQDAKHPKPFVQGKDLVKWTARNIRYLEWGTKRAPQKFSRPTFPELHEVKEKLLAMKNTGDVPKTIYDNGKTFFDSTVIGFVPWHYLKGVVNRSIDKTCRYRNQRSDGDREKREETSNQFHLKYLLAVMNSSFAHNWLNSRRRHNVSIYPDDWKGLPIAVIPLEEQAVLVSLVDEILALFKKSGIPLESESAERVKKLETELDERVNKLFGCG